MVANQGKVPRMMRAASICLLCLIGLAGCAPRSSPRVSQAEPTPARPAEVRFMDDYSEALAVARRQGRPLLVFFEAEWCDHCRATRASVLSQSDVAGLSDRFVCVSINADRETAVCAEHRVAAYPTIEFLSPGGVPLNRVVGQPAAERLVSEMRAALSAVARRDNAGERLLR